MTITINFDSRAYLHSGGTKYYRLAAVSIKNSTNGKSVYALLTNYGSFKSEKGDIHGHKPINGGTSSIEYFGSDVGLSNKLNAESIRRRARGYSEVTEARIGHSADVAVSELGLTDVLRGKIGVIAGHYAEIMSFLELGAEVPAAPALGDVLKKAKKTLEDTHHVTDGRRKRKVKLDSTPAASPEPKMPEIDRGSEWGSW